MLPKGFQIKSHLFKTPNPGFSCLSGYRGVRFPSMGTCAPRSAEVEFDCRKPLQIYGVCSTALRPGTEVSGRHLRAKVALPAGTRGGTWAAGNSFLPTSSSWASWEGWQDTGWSRRISALGCMRGPKAEVFLHGHSWNLEDMVHLQAVCSSGLLIPHVLWVIYLGSPSTSALLAALGENQQLVLVLVTQPMSSHPCPCPLPCRHQSIQAHAKEAHTSPRSLHTSPGGFFPAGFACPGLVPQF